MISFHLSITDFCLIDGLLADSLEPPADIGVGSALPATIRSLACWANTGLSLISNPTRWPRVRCRRIRFLLMT